MASVMKGLSQDYGQHLTAMWLGSVLPKRRGLRGDVQSEYVTENQ
jgi:hypothetical protein